MKKKIIDPYENWIILGYFLLVSLFILFQIIIFLNPKVDLTTAALLQLGRVMGGAFAFLFSLGLYLAGKSDKISQRGMPLFPPSLLIFCLIFAVSIILPFFIHSINLQGQLLKQGILSCYILSFLCLTFIPFAYESIQKRHEPRQVLLFLRKKAMKNIEKTKDYTESWRDVLVIDKICRTIYETDVDVFASGIRYLCAILNKGIEYYEERKEIILNGKLILINEWVRLLQTRIIWIGEKVVEDRLAFERVIIAVIAHIKISEVIFNICYYLCEYAHKKEQEESMEICRFYFIPWCKENKFYEKCKDLENL